MAQDGTGSPCMVDRAATSGTALLEPQHCGSEFHKVRRP